MLRERERRDGETGRQQAGRQRVRGHETKPERRAEGVREKQDGQHGVVAHRVLRAKIVAAEEEGRNETGDDPMHATGQRAGAPPRAASADRAGLRYPEPDPFN